STLHGCEHDRDSREIMEEFIDQVRGLLPHPKTFWRIMHPAAEKGNSKGWGMRLRVRRCFCEISGCNESILWRCVRGPTERLFCMRRSTVGLYRGQPADRAVYATPCFFVLLCAVACTRFRDRVFFVFLAHRHV
ncbi:unnamed protein product, partial [Ectocarpus fasciculatus]